MDQIVPRHIAIIPDGNRRWAKANNLTSAQGHEAGFLALKKILEECCDSGPEILSFYAFSVENFKRSESEIKNLFSLLEKILKNFVRELKKQNIKLIITGSRKELPSTLAKKLNQACQECSTGKFILNIYLNYGSQQEIIQAVQQIAQQCLTDTLQPADITKELLETFINPHNLPPVDLLIRTSGEYRISNFLLWQCAYSEFLFSPKLWPDFTPEDFQNALIEFKNRNRRFGT